MEHFGSATIYHGDCLEIMRELEVVDHVISDPPYEDELHKAMGRIRRADGREMVDNLGFEGVQDIRRETAAHCARLSSGWVILFTLAEGVRAWRDELQANKAKYDTCLFWIKPDATPRMNGQGAARGAECAVTAWCGPGYRSWNAGGKRGVYTHLTNQPDRSSGHPTEKPLPLMLELISDFTKPGQTILDPFMGSGTTGVAALRLGRKFIGIEKERKYYDAARVRISSEAAQENIFSHIEREKQGNIFG